MTDEAAERAAQYRRNIEPYASALRMVREALEELGPVKAGEYCYDPIMEGEALVEAILRLGSKRDTAPTPPN